MGDIDDTIDGIEELQANIEDIDGENQVSVTELFPPKFMSKHTESGDFEEFVEDSPWAVESEEDFEAIPEDEWDDYVRESTTFDGWEEMQKSASGEWAKRQLGL